MNNHPSRAVFATDLGKPAHKRSWEPWSALEIGFDRSGREVKIQVIYRTYDGVATDISNTVRCSGIPNSDKEAFDLNRSWQEGDQLKLGFDIHVDSLDEEYGRFDGTVETDRSLNRPWRGRSIGITITPIDTINAGPQKIDSHVETFLAITPLRLNSADERFDQAQAWSHEILKALLCHAAPSRTASLAYHNLQSLRSMTLDRPFMSGAASTVPSFLSPDKILVDSKRFLSVACMHFLCQKLKSARWATQLVQDLISDKLESFFVMMTCKEEQLNDAKENYGSSLAAAREAVTLRYQYELCSTRCYQLAYWALALPQWTELEQAGAATVFDKVKQTLESVDYKRNWLPKLINIEDQIGAMPISERVALIGDKLRLLQRLSGRDDEEVIKSILLDLLHAANLSGIARQSLIESPGSRITLDLSSLKYELDSFQRLASLQIAPSPTTAMSMGLVNHSETLMSIMLYEDAEPLGLYRSPTIGESFQSKCTIL